MPSTLLDNRELKEAWAEHDRQVTISNFKVACTIGALTMPAGVVLDKAMYPELAGLFLELRFICAALILLFLGILLTPLGHKHYRLLGVTLFMLPASFIAWMIYKSPDGATSPYYAGLNLVILVLAFVLHWTFWESFTAASLVLLLYVGASVAHGGLDSAARGDFVNNLYFLVLTGVIVMTGSYFHSKTRFREFAFRFELDKNKRALEQTNQKLDSQNKELADTLQKLTEAESQLVQQEKMASLGVMSAGIIHEINNPLNFATTGLLIS
jgi:two-component system sensor histidine kinase PhcS